MTNFQISVGLHALCFCVEMNEQRNKRKVVEGRSLNENCCIRQMFRTEGNNSRIVGRQRDFCKRRG